MRHLFGIAATSALLMCASAGFLIAAPARADTDPEPDKCCVGGRPYTPGEMATICTRGCDGSNCAFQLNFQPHCKSAWFNAECIPEEPRNCTRYNLYPAPDVGGFQCVEVACTYTCWLIFTCNGFMCNGGVTLCPPDPLNPPSYNYCFPETECSGN